MPAKPSGEIRTIRVRSRRKNGDIYVLERQIRYDPAKKQNVVLHSRLLGKIPKGQQEMVPTRQKRERAEGKRPPAAKGEDRTGAESDRMRDILAHIGRESGIEEALSGSTDRHTAQRILTLAQYRTAQGSPDLTGLLCWQLRHALPDEGELTEEDCRELFARAGAEEELLRGFCARRRADLSGERSRELIFDLQAPSPFREVGLPDSQRGGSSAIRLFVLCGADASLPDALSPTALVWQRKFLSFGERVRSALASLAIPPAGRPLLVTDRGWQGEAEMAGLRRCGVDVLTSADLSCAWVRQVLDGRGEELERETSVCSADPDLRLVSEILPQSDGSCLFVHLFRDERRRRQEEELLRQERMSERIAGAEGCFALVSDQVSDGAEALRLCRQRGRVAAFFSAQRPVGGPRREVWTEQMLRGRLVVEFVALCLHEALRGRIGEICGWLGREIAAAAASGEQKKTERELLLWLQETPVPEVLQWFALRPEEMSSPVFFRRRWNAEVLRRDEVFLHLLGMEESPAEEE